MTHKGKVYAVTVSESSLQDKIHQFAATKSITDTTAAKQIIERYFLLSYEQREALEAKVQWQQHRNKGFRTLKGFLPKVKA